MKVFNWFLTILFIFFIISSLFLISGNQSTNKVDLKVYKSLEKEENVRVIVVLKDSKNLDKTQQTLEKNKVMSSVSNSKLKSEFSSFNGFSASLNRADIERLNQDLNVKEIYYDSPVHAFLQQSVPLINATITWPLLVNGINLTGKGQTVCIIDTGVNYTHPALGGCILNNFSFGGNNVSYVLESDHNYTNNYDNTWKINYTGFSNIAIHFRNISLEYQGQAGGYDSTDRIIIYDSNLNELASYNGGVNGLLSNIWTPYSTGDSIYVRLVSDNSVTAYGFYIDTIKNGTTNTTYNWSACNKVIYGWDFVNNDGNPMDDEGHGTHVAGIVAANGSIRGVAPEANIVSAKALDSTGFGWNSDIIYGIEFCTNLSTKYNISVISMSLGDGVNYTGYCDSSDPLTAAAINAAVAKNISVIVASGNSHNSSAISSPACIQNATPIGASTKLDAIATAYSNRNSITQLFAPGSSINSTYLSSTGYAVLDGTSMATPHVAGAFAIMNQYLSLTGQKKNPQEIESIFNATGKQIHDSSSNLNFSRIDVYSAISSLDSTPDIDFSLPTNVGVVYTNRNNLEVNVSSSSTNIKNITIYLYNSTRNLVNSSFGTSSFFYTNFTNLVTGIYYYNATVFTIFSRSNNTLTRNITVDLVFPGFSINSTSGLFVRYSNFTANVTLQDNLNLLSARLESNHTGNLVNYSYSINGTTSNLSSSFNITTSLKSFSYRWVFNDSAGNSNSTAWRFISVINTAPINFSIEAINWTMNSNKTINLSQYFLDIDGDELNYTNTSANNLSISINQTTKVATLIPQSGFNGTSYIRFIANDSFNITYSNNITLNIFKPIISINYSIFNGATTNFSNLTNFINISIIIENIVYASINFSFVDLNNSLINIDNYINISYNHIEINSTHLPFFNRSATLNLFNLTWNNPRILVNGINCTSCVLINYTGGNLTFNVSGFSTYATDENPYCGDASCNNGESCSSCSNDCGACPPSGGGSSGGGGGSIVKPKNVSNVTSNLTVFNGNLSLNNQTNNYGGSNSSQTNLVDNSNNQLFTQRIIRFALVAIILLFVLGIIFYKIWTTKVSISIKKKR